MRLHRPNRVLWAMAAGLVVVFLISLLIGRYPQPGIAAPWQMAGDDLAMRLIWNLRLPRLLTALLLGASLSAAGAAFQMLFTNPLVEPGFLGVSQGAAFGAALAIIALGNAAWLIQGSAVLFAFLGLALSYFLARRVRFGGWVLRLVLAGIAVSAFFSSGVGILKFLADPLSQLPEITFWLLGGLWSIEWKDLLSILPLVLIGLYILYRMRWRLNLLSLEDEVAFSLGTTPQRERTLVLAAGVAATAAVISVSGIVGWVGLLVPHLARRIFGADGRYVIPASILLGAGFTVICDDIGRTLLAGEIPLGILTSLLGALAFMLLMMARKVQVQR
ncbi:MAG TPA: iron ABC transporter permease [Anaerolineaceae bacterium]|nr:iron ABC transporter permease [Anaerolineaceae bacterium]